MLKRTRIDSKGQTRSKLPAVCSSSLYPNLDALFVQLAHNKHPNVIEMMGAIEDLVAFSTEGDINRYPVPVNSEFMSQKKCRFCD